MSKHLKYNPKLKERARKLRNNSTLSEVLLWREIKGKKLGFDFHRQKPIGHYIVDFYCPKLKLVIEIDGISHDDKIKYDKKRDTCLEEIGLAVLHFDDIDIKKNLNSVLENIKDWIEKNKNKFEQEEITHPPAKAVPLSRGDLYTPRLKPNTSQEGIYQGVKFKTNFIYKTPPIHEDIEELKNWCRIFHEKNLAPPYPGGSFGNLSFRTRMNTFIITGSRIGLKCSLIADCFVEVFDCDSRKKELNVVGLREPSSETMLHAAIYQKRPDVRAIFHGHSPELLQNAKRLHIPETKEEKPYGTIELVESVLEIIDKNNLIMMKNHGFIAVGSSMAEAGELVLRYLAKVIVLP
ncbi:MAG: DUF559 domain-containing protein [Candidatus Cloacimonadales bacterium]|nr:DUF559 domain-containing protein [Candidatus Cloacimonadales bacterium]